MSELPFPIASFVIKSAETLKIKNFSLTAFIPKRLLSWNWFTVYRTSWAFLSERENPKNYNYKIYYFIQHLFLVIRQNQMAFPIRGGKSVGRN